MKAVTRRVERENKAVIEFLNQRYSHGLEKDWCIDNEENNRFLEGTGSLSLDHINKIAYASISERTNNELLQEWANYYKFKVVSFTSEQLGKQVYHTNVVMAVGLNFVVIGLDIIDQKYHESLLQSFKETGKTVIPITGDQILNFCGNVLEIRGTNGKRLLAMSSRAFNNFTEEQKKTIYDCGIEKIVHSDISTLENIGGGSCRCMLAELF